MSKIRIYGDTSGYVDLTAPAVSDNSAIDISNPTFSGNVSANGTITSGVDSSSYMRVGRYSSGYGGSALNTYGGSSFLSVQVEGVEAIRASSSGYVTTPYQPAFDVSQSAGSQSTGKQNYDTVYVNIGSCFNTTNSRFTAPISGTYIFFTTIIKNSNSAGVARLQLYKNGTATQGLRQLRLSEGVPYATNGVGSWIITLSQNDYIEVYNTGDAASYGTNEYQYFNGFLIG